MKMALKKLEVGSRKKELIGDLASFKDFFCIS